MKTPGGKVEARMRMYHPRVAGRCMVHKMVDVAFS